AVDVLGGLLHIGHPDRDGRFTIFMAFADRVCRCRYGHHGSSLVLNCGQEEAAGVQSSIGSACMKFKQVIFWFYIKFIDVRVFPFAADLSASNALPPAAGAAPNRVIYRL